MRQLITFATVSLVALVNSAATDDDEHKYLKAFPAAEDGMSRYVIELPHKERGEEDNFKVEITVGKEVLTDGVNLYHLGGKIDPKPLKGWGFTFYQVAKFGPVASTRKAVPPGTPQVKKFVAMPSTTISYNSRIPIVVYVPEGGEVRYRIWSAPKKMKKAERS